MAHELIPEIYQQLHRRVYSGYGHTTNSPIRLSNLAAHPIIIQEIDRLCGLILTPVPDKGDHFTIQATNQLKICKIKDKSFDFPDLFHEDCNRNAYWCTHLDEIAEAWIDKCVTHLETMPTRFYGIPDRVTILDDGCTAFSGKWYFSNLKLKYSCLNQERVDELAATINRKMSHGEIIITPGDYFSCMWVYFQKAPDKVIEDAYYDYATFYERFDHVTPELQKIFNDITLHIKLSSPEQQILALQSKHQFVYMFDCDQKQI